MSPVYCFITLVLRIFLKRGTLGLDDALVAGATVFQCGQAAAIFLALKRGTGTAFTLLSAGNISSSSEAVYSANILFILSLALSKASVVCLLMRIFNLAYTRACHSPRFLFYRHVCLATIGFTAAWAVGSIIALTVNCSADSFMSDQQSCPAQITRWAVITGVDVFLECLLVAMTVVNVIPLQLSITIKVQIIVSFAFRIICIVFSVLHFYYVKNFVDYSNDGLNVVQAINMMQLGLCWSIISATIPTLKAFVKSFNSGFGLGVDTATAYFGSAPHSAARHNYELSKIKGAQQSQQQSHSSSVQVQQSANRSRVSADHEQPVSKSSVDSDAQTHDRTQSITSNGSQERIIRKDVRWTVEYDSNNSQNHNHAHNHRE